MWQVNFTPAASLVLERYWIRVRFNDTDSAFSEYVYIRVWVKNNVPVIVVPVADRNETEDGNITLDLLANGSDSENPSDQLAWYLDWSEGIDHVTGNGTTSIVVYPILDFNGNVTVTLTLMDLDGAFVTQDVVLSWIAENDPPRVSALELASDTYDLFGEMNFHIGSTLSAVLHDLSDPEGDNFTVYYSWLKGNSTYIIENSTNATSLSSDNFQRDDIITLRVLFIDDYNSVYYSNWTSINNAPPTIDGVNITIMYGSDEVTVANESTHLIATPYGYNDLDGDAAVESLFTYQWYVSGFLAVSDFDLTMINGTYFNKDDEVYCRVLPYDGENNGSGGISSTIHVFNSAPYFSYLGLDHTGSIPNKESTIIVNLSGFMDIDGDIPDLDLFQYTWYKDGQQIADGSDEQTLTVYDSGVYVLEVISGPCKGTSDAIRITLGDLTPGLNYSGTKILCLGGFISFVNLRNISLL